MIKVKNTDGTWSIVTGAGGNASIIEKTYSDLKTLRDGGNLTKGQLYRITNYVAYTSQSNTQSANKQFDIIVLADSANSFNENAWAINHTFTSGTDPFASCNLKAWEIKYCFDQDSTRFSWGGSSTYDHSEVDGKVVDFSGATQYIYNYDNTNYAKAKCILDTDNVERYDPSMADLIAYVNTAYSSYTFQFEDSGYKVANLTSAKDSFSTQIEGETYTFNKLVDRSNVHYTVYDRETGDAYIAFMDDNADYTFYVKESELADGATMYWIKTDFTWTDAETVTHIYTAPEGFRGIIYYMKDEWNNEAPFDFKGIQIQNTKIDSCSQTEYLTTAFMKNKYVPSTMSVYAYSLGTDTAWYYLFGDSADTDGSLDGTYKNSSVKGIRTAIPMLRVAGSDNILESNCNNCYIEGVNTIVQNNCSNIALCGTSYEVAPNCYSIVVGSGSYTKFSTRCYNIAFDSSYYNIISGSGKLVLSIAAYCEFANYTENIYSAAKVFSNNSLTDVQSLTISSASASVKDSTMEHSSKVTISATNTKYLYAFYCPDLTISESSTSGAYYIFGTKRY